MPAACTLMERLLEEVSFNADYRAADRVDAQYVRERLGSLAEDHDLSHIL